MLAPALDRLDGTYSETAALRLALQQSGIVAPHTGQPYTEALLLGVAGGLSITYFLYEFSHLPPIFLLNTRMALKERPLAEFLPETLRRLRIPFRRSETGSVKTAEKALRGFLAEGRAPVADVDLASLSYTALPAALCKYFQHTVLIMGLDDSAGEAIVADRSAQPLRIPQSELAAARSAIGSVKNRLLVADPPTQPADLRQAITLGLRDNLKSLFEPPMANMGLPGLRKWADQVADPKDRKGWPKVLPPGSVLYSALKSLPTALRVFGGGYGLRDLYADFLDEAGAILGNTELGPVAATYREASALWGQLPEAALPDSAPLLKETRELLARKDRLFREQGQAAVGAMQAIEARLDELNEAVKEAFPLSQSEVDDLLTGLKAHLLRLYEVETRAATMLAAAVP